MKTWQKLKQNPQLIEKYLKREQVIDALRAFFKTNNFHEVETPLLVKSPGTEPYLEVFETQLKIAGGGNHQAFLLTSPEYAMKKLLTAGVGHIFTICKSFRNGEGLSSRHNPEFTILEWYRANANYIDIMKDFEQMMLFINQKLRSKNQNLGFKDQKSVDENLQILSYQGKNYDLTAPYPKMTVAEAFKKYVGVNAEQLLLRDELIKVAKKKGYDVTGQTTWEEVYNQLFLNEIETKLAEMTTPVIIYDYPASQAALSKKKKNDPRFAERFEVYLAGLELGNAFSELTNAQEQESRFKEELQLRKDLGKVKYVMDQDFIDALKAGMPESGGIAVGVDRLVMLFADAASIEETLFFPAREIFTENASY